MTASTEIGTLLDTFDERVRAIVPSATLHSDRRWRTVDDIDSVPGGEIRMFYIDADEPVPVEGGIYSPSQIEHEATVRVFTNYGNVRRRQKIKLTGPDGRQIWLAWDTQRDPIIPGLISVVHDGWEEEDDEQARLWGAHVYTVRFVAPGVP